MATNFISQRLRARTTSAECNQAESLHSKTCSYFNRNININNKINMGNNNNIISSNIFS